MTIRRIVTAYVISPGATPLAMFLLFVWESLSAALFLAIMSAIVSYGVTLTFGIPCHLLLIKLKARKLVWYVLAGFAIGAVVPTYIFLFMNQSFQSTVSDFQNEPLLPVATALSFGLLGILNAIVFWRLVRPDQQAERT
ncbi:membrane hypothetical protein [Rhodospirillaceae bacterium LM-1]|nr:membrane hypothetical protein [Rhodospirillaceae bacterium LM-1]